MPGVGILQSREAIVFSMQICSLTHRILSLVGGIMVPERCWQTRSGTDGAIYIKELDELANEKI